MRCIAALLCALAVARGEGLEAKKQVEGFVTNGKVVKAAGEKHGHVIPGLNRLEFTWSDEPLVVHIPFTVDGPPGEPVWAMITVGYEGFDEGRIAGKDKMPMYVSSWHPDPRYGLARLGDKKWHDGIRLLGKKLVREPDADYAVGARDEQPFWLRRIPKGKRLVGAISRLTAYFPPEAPRGAYALWFVVPAQSIRNYSKRLQSDEIKGTFRAVVFTARQEREPSFYEFKVAAGLLEHTQPDRPNLSLWVRCPDVHVEVTSKANGWVIDKSYVQKETGPEKVDRTLTGSRGTFQGSASHSREGWAFTTNYRVTLPHRIRDWSVFDVQVSGSLEVHQCWKKEPFGPWEVRYLSSSSGIEGMPKELLDEGGDFKQDGAVLLFEDEKGKRDRNGTREQVQKSRPEFLPHWLPAQDWKDDKPGSREGVYRMYKFGPPQGTGYDAVQDQGPWALFHFNLSWVGEVVQTYRRRSDVESNHKGKAKPPPVVTERPTKKKPHDGFPKWFEAVYCPTVAKAHGDLDAYGAKAAAIGLAVAGKRKHIRILTDALAVVSEHRSQAAWNKMQRRQTDAEAEIRYNLSILRDTVKDAEKVIDEVLARIAEQRKASDKAGRKREQLERWRKEWDDRKFALPLELYLKGEDHESWDAQMHERDLRALPAHQQLQLAHMYLDRQRVARATFVLRSLVRAAPRSPEAKEAYPLISRLEAGILRAIAGKMSGEVEEARGKFFGWLESRGISQKQPVGLLSRGFEYFWTILSTGPGAFASYMAGRTEAMEAESKTVAEAGFATWLGLKAMIRLAERGLTLEEMGRLDTFHLRLWLDLEKATGKPYSDADCAALGAQIRMALALPEIKALLQESEEIFKIELEKAHFKLDGIDLSELKADRWEYGFDAFSAKNTAMILLPMSVGTIGGKLVPLSWRPWGMSKANNALKAAQFLGKEVRTGQEVLAAATGWARALESLAGSKVGLRIYQQLELVHQSGGIVWKATWGASPLLADIALGFGIVHVAHEYGGPHVAAATEAVVYTFLWDPTLMASLMRRSRTTPAMIKRLAKRYNREVRHFERELEHTRTYLLELQEVLRARKRNPARLREIARKSPVPPRKPPTTIEAPPPRPPTTVDAPQRKPPTTIDAPPRPPTTVEAPSGKFVDPDAKTVDLRTTSDDFSPGPNHLSNQQHAVAEANAAIQRGDVEDAAYWAEAAANLSKAAEDQLTHLQWVRENLRAAVEWLAKQKITMRAKVALKDYVDLAWKKAAGTTDYDSLIFEADFLRLKGDFEGAAKKYRAAAAEYGIKHGSQANIIDTLQKIHIMEEAIQARRTASKAALNLGDAPTLDQIDEAVRKSKSMQPLGTSGNPVFEIPLGAEKFALKRMTVADFVQYKRFEPETAQLAIEKMMRAEMTAAALGDLFGVAVLPTAGRLRRDQQGRLIGEIMTPWTTAPDADALTIGKLLAVKDQYAEHRVFSMILGDYDRHLGNFKVINGRLITMDSGQGQLMRWGPEVDRNTINQWIVDHWWNYGASKIDKNHKMLEQSLVFGDMAPAFAKAKKIFAERPDEVKRRLRKAMDQLYEDADEAQRAVDEAFEVMEKRLGWIEERTKVSLGERNGFPINEPVHRTSWLAPKFRKPAARRLAA